MGTKLHPDIAADTVALVRRKMKEPAKLPDPTAKDRARWLDFKAGRSIEEIAARNNTSVAVIQESINEIERYHLRYSNQAIAIEVNRQVLESLPKVATVWDGGLKAKKIVPVGGGKTRTVDDHATRLKTAESIKSFAELAQPKGPGFQLNQQFNNGGSQNPSYQAGMSFESRLRAIRERRGLTNGEDQEQIIDAEVDEEQSLEDELADQGIDLADADEDGDAATA